jgi:threonine aldolase
MTAKIAVDLFSDTMTRPSPGMRQAMSEAEVGDEQRGEDPTVNLLQELVADLLGKDAALFLPSGTMCNQISFALHCRPGNEILMDETAHPLNFEAGGPAAMASALVRPLRGERGIFTATQVTDAIRPLDRHNPKTRAVSVEQTTNIAGGACWPLETIHEVCAAGRGAGLALHLDGARLLNAVVAKDVAASEYAAPFDSAWIDMTKGLGAPVGAVLAGTKEFIDDAWVLKQRFGGAMRQAGVIAAGGVYALRHNVERLADDHRNAARLAQGLAELPGVMLDADVVETNIVVFAMSPGAPSAQEFADRMLAEHGVRFSQISLTQLRAVTHLDVSAEDIDTALDSARRVLA